MEKLSAEQVQYLLAHSAEMLEKAAQVISNLQLENESFRRREEATKLAAEMQDKNLSPAWGSSNDEIVDYITGLPQEKLAAVRMATEMAAPHDPFAHLDSSRDGHEGAGRVKGASSFEQFVYGNI